MSDRSVFREDLGRRQSLYRLAIARSDIQAAREVARYAKEHVRDLRDELWIPLQEALVVAYARPFSSNKPYGPISNRWAKFANPTHQELHRNLIDMRNELIAHADASTRSIIIFPPNTRPSVAGREPGDRVSMAVSHKRRPPEFFGSVRELCDDLLGRLHAAVQEELQALFGEVPSSVRPFNLLTGEEVIVDVSDSVVISEHSLPIRKDDRSSGA